MTTLAEIMRDPEKAADEFVGKYCVDNGDVCVDVLPVAVYPGEAPGTIHTEAEFIGLLENAVTNFEKHDVESIRKFCAIGEDD